MVVVFKNMSCKSRFIVVVFYKMSRKSRFRVVVFPNGSRLVSGMNRFLPRAQKQKTIFHAAKLGQLPQQDNSTSINLQQKVLGIKYTFHRRY